MTDYSTVKPVRIGADSADGATNASTPSNESAIGTYEAQATPTQVPVAQATPASPNNKHQQDQRVSRLGTSPLGGLIAEFALPAITGMIVSGAYAVIDSVFLGQAMGSLGLSAATVAAPFMILIVAFGVLIGNGGNTLAALRLGEGKVDEAEHVLGNTVLLCLVLGIAVFAAVCVPAVMDGLLALSSATPEVAPFARTFITIIGAGMFVQMIGICVNNFIRSAGAPNRALITMLIGTVVCIIANYLLVLRFGLGVEGSALATLIGQSVTAISVLWYFTKTKNVAFRLRVKNLRPRAHLIKTMIVLGIPSFIVQIGIAVLCVVLNILIVQYGETITIGTVGALASIGVVQRVALFSILPLVGITVAIQPLLGFNYGAKLYSRVKSTLLYGIVINTVFSLVMWLIIRLFPLPIVQAFGISNPDLLAYTEFAMQVQLFMLPLVGFQIVGSNYFQATGQPTISIILSLMRQMLVLVPVLLTINLWMPQLFPQFTQLDCLNFAMPLSDIISTTVALIFVVREVRRLNRTMKEGSRTRTLAP